MSATLTDNAKAVLRARYLARENGVVVETFEQLFRRVAQHVSAVELRMGYGEAEVAAGRERFERMMATLEFLPNSPTLMNAGRPLGQLAACFVVPVEDSTRGVFEAVRWAAEIQKTGGGTGFSFSRLRPAGDLVASTGGNASGPVSLMQVFDVATEAIKQGGTRRGANMGMLRVDHPDILEFIALKLDPTRMRNFNLSVAVTDAFMSAVRAGTTYDLVNPRTGNPAGQLDARRVLDAIANAAWAVGDPGMVFIDRINDLQPTPQLGPIEATNPCVVGETRVLVEGQGLRRIADLVGSRPRIATFDAGRLVYREATRVVATGVRPVYAIRTREGHVLRATADHLVTTERGDVAVEVLEPGDRIRALRAEPRDLARDSADARLGEVIGWLTGRGRFTVRADGATAAELCFDEAARRDAAPRLRDTIRSLVGEAALDDFERDRSVDPSVDPSDAPSVDPSVGSEVTRVRSARLCGHLRDLGVTEACKQRVPERVLAGSDELAAGYLRGLLSAAGRIDATFADGVTVRLASAELPLLRDVQLVLARVGVCAVLASGGDEVGAGAQPELVVQGVDVREYARASGFVVGAKTDQLAALLGDVRPGAPDLRAWLSVRDVTLDGDEPVYDLSEPTTRHFFANGMLVHNCGEQPLLPFESCTLGSIDVGKFVRDGELAWDRLRATIHDAVRFLDDVIDANRYPLPEIEAATKATRKIGLGIMGWADALAALDIAYDSEDALALAARMAAFLEDESLVASRALAARRGAFPAWHGSRWQGDAPLRNATTTTIAPTGTISIIAGCSSGIEPLYALAYRRNVLDGAELPEVNPAFSAIAAERGFGSPELFAQIAERGGVRGNDAVPADVQRAYPTAHEIDVATHVRMQAAFQRHVHAAVSKTINLPRTASALDVKAAYELAYELGCKGITVYRDTSREGQVLVTGPRARSRAVAEGCPECGSALVVQSACRLCRHCGWSVCG